MLMVHTGRNIDGGADLEHGEVVCVVDLVYFCPARVQHVSCAREHSESHY